jgi:hypothetical protein
MLPPARRGTSDETAAVYGAAAGLSPRHAQTGDASLAEAALGKSADAIHRTATPVKALLWDVHGLSMT